MTQNVIHLPEKDSWQRLVASKREAARAKGLTEADVPRLIEEARRERREH
jgi:hypothetical protein